MMPRAQIDLPNNPAAEQGLLGTILVDNRAFDKVSDFLQPEHFFVPVHGRIYGEIHSLLSQGKTCSPVVIAKSFANDPELEGVGGVAYFADLASSVVTILNVEEYGRSIFDLWLRRQIIYLGDEAVTGAQKIEPGSKAIDLVSEMESKLYEATQGVSASTPEKQFCSAVTEAVNAAGAAYRKDPGATGIPTGLIDLDKLIGDLSKPDLVILAGRPGMGKTSAATGIAFHIAGLGKRVAFFSLEMSAEQLATRILASAAGVPGDLIKRGDVHRDQFNKFMDASQRLADLPLYIDDTAGQTIAHIRRGARRIKRRYGLDLIVVDYLQLIRSLGKNRAENRVQEITEITCALKNLAKEFEVPVLALSQLSRAVEQREDKRPQLSDLRESGSIEQDADIVAFVFREEYYVEKDEPTRRKDETQEHYNERYAGWTQRKASCAGRAEIIVAKNRHGANGTAILHFDGPTTTFSNFTAYYSAAGAM